MKTYSNQFLYFGLGLWDFIKEKGGALLSEITRRGELRRQEDPHIAESISERLRRDQEAFWDKAGVFIRKVIAEMGLARASDLKALQDRVAALEEELRSRQKEADPNV